MVQLGQELLIPVNECWWFSVPADAVLENLIGSPPSTTSDDSTRKSDGTPEKKELEREDGSAEGRRNCGFGHGFDKRDR